jgi:hypothetical protein
MPAITPDAKTLKRRADLCGELLGIHYDNDKVFKRIEAIKAELQQMANELDRSFKETDVKLGHVSVSPSKGEEFKGDFPVVDVRKYQALTEAKRKNLLEAGIIKIESEWSRPYNGRVSVEIY